MSRRRASSSGGLIERERLAQDAVSEVGAQKTRRVEVDLAAEETGQLVLNRNEAEARRPAGLELDKDVHVAVRAGVAAQHRAEQREPTDPVAPAEGRERFPVDGEVLR